MTSDKLIQVFTFYRDELITSGVGPTELMDYDSTGIEQEKIVSLGHLTWMCEQAIIMVSTNRKEKAFRWLGFIQGVLWSQGIYTLDELKNHSRPAL